MDLNDIRMAVTLLAFVAFIGIAAWAWSRRQEARFAEAALLPFVAERNTDAAKAEKKSAAPTDRASAPAQEELADGYPHRRRYRAKLLPKPAPKQLP